MKLLLMLCVFGLCPLPVSSKTLPITVESVLVETNQSRASNHIQSVSLNESLSRASQKKAQALLECQCFQHTLPDGRKISDFIKPENYVYIAVAENLAIDFADSDKLESAWMNSEGHRKNILNNGFKETGIGIAEGKFQGHQSIIVVQTFATRYPTNLSNYH